ncbi:MAG: hypothetical protein M1817_005679 [Caeruleum heppii]|nr:MAG: hypothetical protein M1817_005679 [Caeruleum heppii]
MPPKRMTANPVRPARYRPGKPVGPVESSSEEEDDDVEEIEEPKKAPPKASSFPSDSAKIASNLKKVNLDERRQQAAAEEAARKELERIERAKEEEGFVTEESASEGSAGSEESGSEEEEEEETSDEEQAKPVLLRPTFIRKDKRKDTGPDPDALAAAEEQRKEQERLEAANEIVMDQLRKEAEARAAGRKEWDDDEAGEIDAIDDTDDLDPEAERAAWKLRELQRIKRDRESIEEAEKEREEIERRRNLSNEEREAEDRDFLAQQKEENAGKGQMGFMQKYFHKGAFFQDDAKEKGLDRRDIMGSRFQDDVTNRELLPQYMQIRDMTRLGRKSRTKYKDLKSEDTGRWGQTDARGNRGELSRYGGTDDRFAPDREGGGGAPTGANASIVRERKRPDAPSGPKAMRDSPEEDSHRENGDSYRPSRHAEDDGHHARHRSRDHDRRSPRRRPRSRSRSRSRRRDRYDDRDGRARRKRSTSAYSDRYQHDKRQKLDVH